MVGRTRAQQKEWFSDDLLIWKTGLHAVQCWYIRITSDVCQLLLYIYVHTCARYVYAHARSGRLKHARANERRVYVQTRALREIDMRETGTRARGIPTHTTHLPSLDVHDVHVCVHMYNNAIKLILHYESSFRCASRFISFPSHLFPSISFLPWHVLHFEFVEIRRSEDPRH